MCQEKNSQKDNSFLLYAYISQGSKKLVSFSVSPYLFLSVCLSHTLLPTHTQFAARVFLGNIGNVLFFHYCS